MAKLTFIDITKRVLGDEFDALCKEWKPSPVKENWSAVAVQEEDRERYCFWSPTAAKKTIVEKRSRHGTPLISLEQFKQLSGQEIVLQGKEFHESEDRFYGIDADICHAIKKGNLHAFEKATLGIPHFRIVKKKKAINKRPLIVIWPYWCIVFKPINTIEDFLHQFYPELYFDEDEFNAAFPDIEEIQSQQSEEENREPDTAAAIAGWEAIQSGLKGAKRKAAQIAIAKLRGFSHAQIYDLVLRGDAKEENKTSIVSRKITHDVAELAEKYNLPMPPGDSRK